MKKLGEIFDSINTSYDINVYEENIDALHTYIIHNIMNDAKQKYYIKKLENLEKELMSEPVNFFIGQDTSKVLNFINSISEYINTQKEKGIIETQEKPLDIFIHPEIYNHIISLLDSKHFFNAVEESFKFVRDKMRLLTGKEKATDAFDRKNYIIIFGRDPDNEIEEEFCEGVKFLHMAIQRFRNEKSHSIKKDLDYNKAIHYITLSSLALTLIEQKL